MLPPTPPPLPSTTPPSFPPPPPPPHVPAMFLLIICCQYHESYPCCLSSCSCCDGVESWWLVVLCCYGDEGLWRGRGMWASWWSIWLRVREGHCSCLIRIPFIFRLPYAGRVRVVTCNRWGRRGSHGRALEPLEPSLILARECLQRQVGLSLCTPRCAALGLKSCWASDYRTKRVMLKSLSFSSMLSIRDERKEGGGRGGGGGGGDVKGVCKKKYIIIYFRRHNVSHRISALIIY